MHERVGGRWGSGGRVEGGPVPLTSLAHSGGRRWEGGRPGPAPTQPRAPLCRAAAAPAAAVALWPRPRLVRGAEGRGAGGAAGPALSGSRPRGGASSARVPLPLRDRSRVRSPSGHCYEAAGCGSAMSACGLPPGLAVRELALGRLGLRLPAGLRLGAGLGPRGASEAENALRPRPGVEVTLRAQIGWGPPAGERGRVGAEARSARATRARAVPAGSRAPSISRRPTTFPSWSCRRHRA